MSVFAADQSLVVRNSQDVHDRVINLLLGLRRAQGLPDAKEQRVPSDPGNAAGAPIPGQAANRLAVRVLIRIQIDGHPDPSDAGRAGEPRRRGCCKALEKLRMADEEWERFWFLDQPSRMTPFTHFNPSPEP